MQKLKEKLEEQNEGISPTDAETSQSQADDFIQGDANVDASSQNQADVSIQGEYKVEALTVTESQADDSIQGDSNVDALTDAETNQNQANDLIEGNSNVEAVTDAETSQSQADDSAQGDSMVEALTHAETSQTQDDDSIQGDSGVEALTHAETSQTQVDDSAQGDSMVEALRDAETSQSQADDSIQGDSKVEALTNAETSQTQADDSKIEALTDVETSQSQAVGSIQGDSKVEALTDAEPSQSQACGSIQGDSKVEGLTGAETSQIQADGFIQGDSKVEALTNAETSQTQADDSIQRDSKVEALIHAETSQNQADDSIQGDSKVEALDCVPKAQGLKEEGNKLFQKRDYEGAMLKYEEAIKILPQDHVEVSHIRANLASCYMQLDPGEYVKAIRECDLALTITPDHTKALLKRARCYEALKKFDLSLKDVCMVSKLDPNNPMASDISDKLGRTLETKGLRVKDSVIELSPDYVEPVEVSPAYWAEKFRKRAQKMKKINQLHEKSEGENADTENKSNLVAEKGKEKIIDKQSKMKVTGKQSEKRSDTSKEQEKVIIEEKLLDISVGDVKKAVKFVWSDDIRLAELPLNCTLFQLREVVHDRFPSLRAVHIKYKDQEGDLVTITTDEELRICEVSPRSLDTMRYYVVEVSPEQDPLFGRLVEMKKLKITSDSFKTKLNRKRKIEDWMIEFSQLFKIQANIDSHACLNLQELGMKLNSEAMEEVVTSDAAQGPFDKAAKQFQELAARSLLKLGNVHMTGARKRLSLLRGFSVESLFEQIKTAYEHAQKDHAIAKEKYEEAMKIKPDWFEVFLALGLQQFEEARLAWYYVLVSRIDLKAWPYAAVVQLYQSAESNIKKSMEGLKNLESKKDCETSQAENCQTGEKVPDNSTQDNRANEAAKLKSWLDVVLCAVLYERSIMEYKLGLPIWRENLEAAMEKYELAEACREDIAAVINEDYVADNTLRDLRFLMEDTIKIINEIYAAEQWRNGISSDQLEEILKKRTAKIFKCQIEESNMVEGFP